MCYTILIKHYTGYFSLLFYNNIESILICITNILCILININFI